MPNNNGGFGAIEPAALVFARNELVPLQAQLMAINEWCEKEVVQFRPYQLNDDIQKKIRNHAIL